MSSAVDFLCFNMVFVLRIFSLFSCSLSSHKYIFCSCFYVDFRNILAEIWWWRCHKDTPNVTRCSTKMHGNVFWMKKYFLLFRWIGKFTSKYLENCTLCTCIECCRIIFSLAAVSQNYNRLQWKCVLNIFHKMFLL